MQHAVKQDSGAAGEVAARSPRSVKREGVIAAGFLVITALFYAPLLFGVRTFPDGDFVHHFFPFSLFQHQALAATQLPVWNPFTYGGHPFLADVQAAVFYPLSNLIYLLTLPVTDAAARFYWLEVEAALHTALAGWFAYLWMRDLTGSRWAGLVGGVSFGLSGYVTGYAPLQLAVLRTAIWLPLLWWCMGRGWQQPRQWRWWGGSVFALSAAFLGGHSQSFLLISYATAAWTLCLAFGVRPRRVAAIVGTMVVVVAAVGLTAAQWLPSLEFVRYSVRANVDYAFVSGGLGWADFWQLLLPAALTQYSPLYIGVVGGVLVGVALVTGRDRSLNDLACAQSTLLPRRVGIFFCLGVVVFALLAALGGNGPLYPLIYRIAPGWSWFRGQERAAFLVAVALSGLAAYGMAALPHLGVVARRRATFLAAAFVVAGVYAFGLLWQLPGATAIHHAQYLLVAGITLLLALVTVLLVALPGLSAQRLAWVVALAVVNLVWANGGVNQLPGTPTDRVRVAPEVLALTAAVNERLSAANGLPGRVYNEYRAYDDYGMRAQVEDVWGSSPLRVATYAALFEQFPLDRMWRLLGVEHVLTWRRELFGPSEVLAEFTQRTDTTYLHRLPQANPRAWLVTQVSVVDDDTTWQHLADHQFDLDERGLVGAEYADFAPSEATVTPSATVTLTAIGPATLDVRVQSASDGLLIVSETWLPGWTVAAPTCGTATCPFTDGAGRSYFLPMRANLALVGVWLPAGANSFTLRYDPPTVRWGLWISGGTLSVLVLLALWHVARRPAAAA